MNEHTCTHIQLSAVTVCVEQRAAGCRALSLLNKNSREPGASSKPKKNSAQKNRMALRILLF